jgi:hypothetical protein
MPDPELAEWSVAFATKRVLRTFLGPRYDRRLAVILAGKIVKHLGLSDWRITRRPPRPRHSGLAIGTVQPSFAVGKMRSPERSQARPELRAPEGGAHISMIMRVAVRSGQATQQPYAQLLSRRRSGSVCRLEAMPFINHRRAILYAFASVVGWALVASSLAGCTALPRSPVPLDAQSEPSIPGFENIRYFPLTSVEPIREAIRQAFLTETPDNYETLADGWRRYDYLAVSGGGSDGAFGAGILNGWSNRGNRPKFKVVTGVSTGALIAPFAFLGSDHDPEIKEAYTTTNPERIYLTRGLISILWEESIADNKPLKDLVSKYITPAILDAIAAQHAKGRRLYVATTNMDREEPVIWDMGAIASSKDPRRLELFRSVLVASASIPAIFPPTLINVKIGNKDYDELHCDGGVFFQSFFVGSVVDLPALIREAHPGYKGRVYQDLYVIRNGSTTPSQKQINRGVRSISERAIATMLKASGINDLYRIFLSTEHDKVGFYFVSLPTDYVRTTEEEFNEAEMNRQYRLGYKFGAEGIPWRRLPPGYILKQPGASIDPN